MSFSEAALVITSDREELLNILEEIEVSGGDGPKKVLQAITAALDNALPKSLVYVFTDTIASDYESESKVIKMIQQKQATV